jgi:hypothetical protein
MFSLLSVLSALCSLLSALCSLLSALCSLLSALYSAPSALLSTPPTHTHTHTHTHRTRLAQIFTLEDIAHNLLPRDGVIQTYVIDGPDNSISDLASFYYLPSTIIGNTYDIYILK